MLLAMNVVVSYRFMLSFVYCVLSSFILFVCCHFYFMAQFHRVFAPNSIHLIEIYFGSSTLRFR